MNYVLITESSGLLVDYNDKSPGKGTWTKFFF